MLDMYEIITKKKRGEPLSKEEIRYFTNGYTSGSIPDYQASSLLMAICLKGMNAEETAELTLAIAESGDSIDLSALYSTVDKHSTGGVGDKTTLIVAPILASLGANVAKMSGKGLGHTGGTIDKLESIPGLSTSLTPDEFKRQVAEIGIAVAGQTGNLAPADKKLYALRDVTATVDSLPLIASSIMGKKLAAGSESIVLDVKCGSGSFMKTVDDARALAEAMVDIGIKAGRRVSAIITDMDRPLGHAIGNSLEVKEAIEVLSGKGPSDLKEICLALATEMAMLSLGLGYDEALRRCEEAIFCGSALEKLIEMVSRQGGDVEYIKNPDKFEPARYSMEIKAERSGYIGAVNTEAIGMCSVKLGAGREKKDDSIDYSAGILLLKKTRDRVEIGDTIAVLFSSSEEKLAVAKDTFIRSVFYSDEVSERDVILGYVRKA